MPARPSLPFVALVMLAALVGACSSPKAQSGAPSTTEVVASSFTEPAVSVSIEEPTSFALHVPLDALGPGLDLTRVYRIGTRLVVWVHEEAAPGEAEVSAQFGVAELASIDGEGALFVVNGTMPSTLWRRTEGTTPATPVAAHAGTYTVRVVGTYGYPLVVRAGTTDSTTSITAAGPLPDPRRRVLDANDLAGVAFGTPSAVALTTLNARFGQPSFDERHRGVCGDDERLVGWGSLVATFRTSTINGKSAEVFSGYDYSAPHAATADGPSDLTTTTGLAPGMSLAELRARYPDAVFMAEADGPSLTAWYASRGATLGGRLSDDVSAAGVVVVEISSTPAFVGRATYAPC